MHFRLSSGMHKVLHFRKWVKCGSANVTPLLRCRYNPKLNLTATPAHIHRSTHPHLIHSRIFSHFSNGSSICRRTNTEFFFELPVTFEVKQLLVIKIRRKSSNKFIAKTNKAQIFSSTLHTAEMKQKMNHIRNSKYHSDGQIYVFI